MEEAIGNETLLAGRTRNQCPVAGGAGLGILPLQRPGIEPGAVGIEPLSRPSRVAAEVVALRVAGDTALEILPRRLAVAQDEPLLGIVESRIEPPSRGEPGAHVTVGAKLPGVVAITAARLPAICRGGVAREEAGRMIARRGVRGVGPVAVETLRPDMTAATGRWPSARPECRGNRGNPVPLRDEPACGRPRAARDRTWAIVHAAGKVWKERHPILGRCVEFPQVSKGFPDESYPEEILASNEILLDLFESRSVTLQQHFQFHLHFSHSHSPMSARDIPCPACGAPGSGKFCSQCGSPRERTACAAPLAAGARFCAACGLPSGTASSAATSRDRTPWLIAGGAVAASLALLLVMVARDSKGVVAQPDIAAIEQPQEGETPPDITNMTPRERFNRLYNRVMRAAQTGDEATVTRFTPRALMAYAQLDSVDADARYHAALIKVHTGEVDGARALGDTILARDPGHLFGFMVRGTVARFRKDQKELSQAYAGFLKRYDQETKRSRPEYGEHQTSLDDFRKAALEATTRRP